MSKRVGDARRAAAKQHSTDDTRATEILSAPYLGFKRLHLLHILKKKTSKLVQAIHYHELEPSQVEWHEKSTKEVHNSKITFFQKKVYEGIPCPEGGYDGPRIPKTGNPRGG